VSRFIISLGVFAVLAIAVGFMTAGRETFDWALALGLFAVALVGESSRLWIRRSRARKRQSSVT
jgi:hypothetical protein